MERELFREGEVVKSGDAEHRGVNAVALRTAFAKDLPGLHPRRRARRGPDLAVGGVVLLLPSRQFDLAAFAAVRDDQAGAPIAAVRDDGGPADGGLRTGQFRRLAAVNRCRRPNRPTATTSRVSATMTTR